MTGVPSMLIAFLAFAVREPLRGQAPKSRPDQAGWGAFFRYIRSHARLMLGMILGTAIMATAIQGTMVWPPTFARRILGASPAEIGTMVAVAIGGIFGGLTIGLLIDWRFALGTRDMALRLLCGFCIIIPPVSTLAFAIGNLTLLFGAVLLMMLTMGASYGPTMAAVQMIAPPEMRGRSAALMLLASNLFGYAFGPMLIGFLANYVFGDPMKIGHAIITCLLFTGPLSAWLVWRARVDFLQRLDA